MLCGDKEGIYVYLWLTHFGILQKLTQDCKATKLPEKKLEQVENDIVGS